MEPLSSCKPSESAERNPQQEQRHQVSNNPLSLDTTRLVTWTWYTESNWLIVTVGTLMSDQEWMGKLLVNFVFAMQLSCS